MSVPTIVAQVIAGLIVVWTNIIILFGLNITPRKEAALETIVNSVAAAGWLIYSAVHTHGVAKVKAARATAGTHGTVSLK